jgi:hypothetical protein
MQICVLAIRDVFNETDDSSTATRKFKYMITAAASRGYHSMCPGYPECLVNTFRDQEAYVDPA